MDSAGDFVVAWQSYGQDGSGYGVFAQQYNANGAAYGSEFEVNTFTAGNQENPSVAMDATGTFVVAWQSQGQDGSGYGVFAKYYGPTGNAIPADVQINSFTTGNQQNPSVSMDAAGDFVVAWDSYHQDGSGYGTYAQLYTLAGGGQGSEFKVKRTRKNSNRSPRLLAMDSAGAFVVTWQSGAFTGHTEDGSQYGVYAQRDNRQRHARGQPIPGEQLHQGEPVLRCGGGDGFRRRFCRGLGDARQDGSGYGVYAKLLRPARRHYHRWHGHL